MTRDIGRPIMLSQLPARDHACASNFDVPAVRGYGERSDPPLRVPLKRSIRKECAINGSNDFDHAHRGLDGERPEHGTLNNRRTDCDTSIARAHASIHPLSGKNPIGKQCIDRAIKCACDWRLVDIVHESTKANVVTAWTCRDLRPGVTIELRLASPNRTHDTHRCYPRISRWRPAANGRSYGKPNEDSPTRAARSANIPRTPARRTSAGRPPLRPARETGPVLRHDLLMEIMGHSSVDVTSRYAHLTNQLTDAELLRADVQLAI